MYHLGILIAGKVEEKEELKNLLMWGEISFHVIVDREKWEIAKLTKSSRLLMKPFGVTH